MAVVKLPRLQPNWDTQPAFFPRAWNQAMTMIEQLLTQILQLPIIVDAIASVNAAAAAAQASADAAAAAAATAQSTAGTAQSSTDALNAEASLVNSYITGFTSPLIKSDSTGLVTIANHSRVYGDSILNPTVSVTGGTISTGAAAGSTVRVYYDDPSRAGGTVTYAYTVDPAAPPVQGNGRHSVGAVTVPAAGNQDGRFVAPPGYVFL